MSPDPKGPLRPPVEKEVDEEIRHHLELRAQEYEARGLAPDAARSAALRRFGDLDGFRRLCRRLAQGRNREWRRREWLGELRQDVFFAIRQMLGQPSFTLAAILTLALGIGATAGIFAIVHAVLLKPFAYREPERVASVHTVWRGQRGGNVSAGNYVYAQERVKTLSPLAAASYTSMNLADDGAPERVVGASVTHEYFEVFGVAPILGRVFTREEDAPGHDQVVVLAHGLWQRRYGGDRAVIGRDIRLGGVPHKIIGVMPEGFDPTVDQQALWKPMAFTPERRAMHDEHFLEVYGRLVPGADIAQANSEMDSIGAGLRRDHAKDFAEAGLGANRLTDVVVGPSRQRLWLLLGAVGLVLLIACANVANLLLARGAARTRELTTRAALGAGRGRIVRQLLTESLALAALGGAAALVVAQLVLRGLLSIAPPDVPRLAEARIDGAVMAFMLLLVIASSAFFGLVPALQASKLDLRTGLIEGGRGSVGGRDRLRRALIAAEVALAVTLLAGAGLLIRSARHLERLDMGFEPTGLLSARISLPEAAYPGHERPMQTFARIVELVEGRPGVASAAVSSQAPLVGGGSNGLIPEGRPLSIENVIQSRSQFVAAGYFETMRIPVRAGRGFTGDDRRGAPKVMVINEALARAAWPGESAIGKRISCCEGGPDRPVWKTVVGVVADVRTRGPAQPVRPEFYLPLDQIPVGAWGWTRSGLTLLVRARDGSPGAIVPALRSALKEVDPTTPLFDVMTMSDRLTRALSTSRFSMLLTAALGILGLALAAVGVYGVIAYFVSQKSREIGVRVALGAGASDVLRLVAGQGFRVVGLGLAIGTLGALGFGRALGGLLVGVSPNDPVTLVSVVVLLAAVAAGAVMVPALAALRVDPARVLSEG